MICPSCTTNLPVATPFAPGVYTVAVSDDQVVGKLKHTAKGFDIQAA
jgi:hypothetical protein